MKVTLIMGPPASGKTTLAQKMSNHVTTWIDDTSELHDENFDHKTSLAFRNCTPATSRIVVDGVKTTWVTIWKLLFVDMLTVNRIGKEPFEIDTDIIIITNDLGAGVVPPPIANHPDFFIIDLNTTKA